MAAFSKAVDVTPEMAARVLRAFQKKGVQCIVAPYEADAQMAYLSLNKMVDFIVSEDSDCIPFGCNRVLFKLEKPGQGQMIDVKRLHLADGLNLTHFSQDMILDMCILSGCDYLPSVEGVGLKTAYQLVSKYKTTERTLRGLRFEMKTAIPKDYESSFYRARLTFKHQTVFCPEKKQLVPLTFPIMCQERPALLDDLSFLGRREHSHEVAEKIANGELNPCTFEPFPDSVDQFIRPAVTAATVTKSTSFPTAAASRSIGSMDAYLLKTPVSSSVSIKQNSNSISSKVITKNPWLQARTLGEKSAAAHGAARDAAAGVVGTGAATAAPSQSSSKFFKNTPSALRGPPPTTTIMKRLNWQEDYTPVRNLLKSSEGTNFHSKLLKVSTMEIENQDVNQKQRLFTKTFAPPPQSFSRFAMVSTSSTLSNVAVDELNEPVNRPAATPVVRGASFSRFAYDDDDADNN